MKRFKNVIAVSAVFTAAFAFTGCSSNPDDLSNNAQNALNGYGEGYYTDYYNYGDGAVTGEGTVTDSGSVRNHYGTMYNDTWGYGGWGTDGTYTDNKMTNYGTTYGNNEYYGTGNIATPYQPIDNTQTLR